GNLVLADTMVVRTEVGTRLERVSDRPGKGEYRPRRDGCVRFSKADVGRKLRATYEYCPLRICLLPPVMATDYEDAWPTVLEVLTQEAVARGFVLADPDEVADALVDLEVSGPEDYPRLAEYLDVGSFVLTGIAASADAVFAGYSTSGHTSVSGNVSTSGNISHISGHEDTHTTTSARYKDIMVVTVGLRIYDGATGNLVGEVYRSDSNRVFFRRFGPTRRSLARYLTEKCVSALLDPQS
ncbi:MAG: hypothetical protein JXA57_12165, partial [Armatimonadetes bacterium]|nr:hypothetical protein [Armatimonadota bacterium]